MLGLPNYYSSPYGKLTIQKRIPYSSLAVSKKLGNFHFFRFPLFSENFCDRYFFLSCEFLDIICLDWKKREGFKDQTVLAGLDTHTVNRLFLIRCYAMLVYNCPSQAKTQKYSHCMKS